MIGRMEIPFATLPMPSVFTGYVAGDPTLEPFLGRRPESLEALTERALLRTRLRPELRDAAAAAALATASRYDAPPPVVEAAHALAASETVAVVTGHQPGLFGGPLFVWHKVATALRLARDLRERAGLRAVAVFWNHDDDHDWGEVNHSYLVNPQLDVQRVRLRLGTPGRALRCVAAGDLIASALDEVRDLLPPDERRDRELAALAPRSRDETLSAHTSRFLLRHFGDRGLVVIEAGALEGAARERAATYHERAETLRAALGEALHDLADHGYECGVDPDAPLLFAITGTGRRLAVADDEAIPEGATPSPGVILRNLWQDELLPTLAYVAGPGETAYLALCRRVYAVFGVPRPAVVPRASLTHVSARLRELLDRWNLDLASLEAGPLRVEERIAELEGTPDLFDQQAFETRVQRLAETFRAGLRDLEPELARIDPRLRGPLLRIEQRTLHDLNLFADKVERHRRRRGGIYKQHARRLCAELRPRGRLQERVLGPLPFLVRYPGFCDHVLAHADPFARGHRLCDLPDPER